MRKEKRKAFVYKYNCDVCKMDHTIYYSVGDFGDPPTIVKCKHCGELYCYEPGDEYYFRPLKEELRGKKCVKCRAELDDSLVPTHKQISCCGYTISLDDDFMGHNIPSSKEMKEAEVNLIYS